MAWTELLWSTAAAQAAQGAPQPGILEQIVIPFGFVFIIFYFLIIRPQSKRQKKQQEFLTALKRGDEVITASGILGKIEGITDQFVTLEVADGVRIKMLRAQVAGSAREETK